MYWKKSKSETITLTGYIYVRAKRPNSKTLYEPCDSRCAIHTGTRMPYQRNVNSTCTIQIWDRQTDEGEQMEEYEIYIKVVCSELKKSLKFGGRHLKRKLPTYPINKFFHSSSALVKAYRALQVPPSLTKSKASSFSRIWFKSSSGSLQKSPHANLMSREAVYALPDGLMPNGWLGMATGASPESSPIETFEDDNFILLAR